MALLRDDLSEDALTSPGDDPDLLAMKTLMDESPEETAEWAKEQGNVAIKEAQEEAKKGRPKQRRQMLLRALEMYSRAIDLKVNSPGQRSVYHSNRAHANMLLKNHGNAMADAEAAINLDPSNIKAYYRAAKAAMLLGKYSAAAEQCRMGMKASEESQVELEGILSEAQRKLKDEEEASQRSRSIIAQAQALCDALRRRRVRVGVSQFQEATRGRRPQLDPKTGLMHWPVVLCYPEPMTVDLIQSFCETDSFSQQLNTIFGEGSEALEWDSGKAYTKDSIELYYQTNATAPLSDKNLLEQLLEDKAGLDSAKKEEALEAAENITSPSNWSEWAPKKWCIVDKSVSLGSVLAADDYIVPGVPVFYVVSTRSEFRQTFLKGEWSPP